jgi:hypothetical protein
LLRETGVADEAALTKAVADAAAEAAVVIDKTCAERT